MSDGAVRFGLRAFRRHAPPFDFVPPRLSFAFPPDPHKPLIARIGVA
ncbi:transcriptional regulator [Burkholderia thailandensis]|nr:transcriptional regulator [Burkholderia thailandensis]QRA09878.1 transcriptional regulator [Burkholderia thailandensis]